MKKIKYIFKVLKYVVFCVFYKTFYNLQNSVKLPPKCRKCYGQWRSQGGARGGDRPPNGPQDRSREKSKSGEKF